MSRGSPDWASPPEYWERSPLSISYMWFSGKLNPVGASNEGQYTVPANRAAIVEAGQVTLLRTAAVVTVGIVRAAIALASGGDILWLAEANLLNNTVGALDHSEVGAPFTLFAGEKVVFTYSNADDAGNSVVGRWSARIIEFSTRANPTIGPRVQAAGG